jgi:CheY-like chemotaxis protein
MSELHGERVLLVEQADGRYMLKGALEHVGFEVDLASDGETALAIAASFPSATALPRGSRSRC